MQKGILFALFLISYSIKAQVPEFSRLGVNEGLSQNSVYGLLQDKQGFLWIGTGDGLNRYDGRHLVQYRGRYNDTSGKGLSARIITGKIDEDSIERLWFGTNNGLMFFDKRKGVFKDPSLFNPALKKYADGIRVLGIDRYNRVWLNNNENKLLILDPGKWSVTELFRTVDSFDKYGELAGDHFYYLRNDGMYRFNMYGKAHTKFLSIKDPTVLKKTSTGKLVVHTKENFMVFDPVSNSLSTYRLPPGNKGIRHGSFSVMEEWPKGVFYLNVSPNGIAVFNSLQNEVTHVKNQPADPSSISSDLVLGSYIDRSSNMWVATEGGGLNRLDLKPSRFKNFPSFSFNRNEAANLMVKSIFRNRGDILIGTFSQGLYILNEKNREFKQRSFDELNKVTSPSSINVFYKDHAGNLWMNVGNAIGLLDTTRYTFREMDFIRDESKVGRSNFAVYAMAEYYPGRYIIGSNYGLHRLDYKDGKISTYNVPADSIYRGHNQGMVFMPDGTLLLGRIRNGYARLKLSPDGSLKEISSGFTNTGIRHFYNDVKRNLIWMASENGLIAYSLSDKTYYCYDERHGMSNSYVYSIIPENDSTLWISTNRGLNKISLRTGNKFPVIDVTPYLQVHGLQSNEFNTGAFHRDSNGTMYFGGVNGINWFSPGEVLNNVFDPAIVLTGVRVNEKPYQEDTPVNYLRSLKLPYTSNTIAINFSALEFTNAEGHVYSYILEGLDNSWVLSGNNNEARYSNLPPGEYVFKVKAGNGNGSWSEKPLSLVISITPPFWQTWWFKLLVWSTIGLVLVITIRAYIHARVNRRIREIEKENAVNEERIRISRDMHDELGTGLTRISLLTEVGKKKSDKQIVLDEVNTTSRKLTEKMGEIIWTLSPQNDTLDSLVAYLKEHFSEVTENLDVNGKAEIPGSIPPVKISYNSKQHLLLVGKEAIHNAIKHSGAHTILFRVIVENSNIVFSVIDDGEGIQKSPGNGKGNGLSNMKWRVEQAGGQLSINSKAGEGTDITWSVPF